MYNGMGLKTPISNFGVGIFYLPLLLACGRHGGLMLVSRSSGSGFSPDLGHCVMFLGKTLYWRSQCLFPHRCINGYHAVYCSQSTKYEELL